MQNLHNLLAVLTIAGALAWGLSMLAALATLSDKALKAVAVTTSLNMLLVVALALTCMAW